jgi:hypothetical protein
MVPTSFIRMGTTGIVVAFSLLFAVGVGHAQVTQTGPTLAAANTVVARSGHVGAARPRAAPPRSSWRWPSRPVLALGGSALVVGLAALATGLRARDLQSVLDARCSSERRCSYEGFERDRDRGQQLWNASRALSIGAGLLGAGALTWWVLSRDRESTTRLGLGVAAGGLAARVERRF